MALDDTATPGSPGWWLLRLGRRLAAEQARFTDLESYHRGDHPLPFGNRKMRDAYKRLQRMCRTNFVNLVAETVLERLKIVGFRSGGDSPETVDKQAWGWWQANKMDADSGLVHRAAAVMSRAYVIVGERAGKPGDPSRPLVTGEDPRQVIHESDPSDRRKVVAALKVWRDDAKQRDFAVLYLPDEICYFSSTKSLQDARDPWSAPNWAYDDTNEFAPDGAAPNPFAPDVPVVPFINRPDLAGNGLGEFEDVTDVQDRINTLVLDRMVISAMQAYRQRWAKGIDIRDKDGNPDSVFDPGADLLWAVESENAQFGEFNPTDIGPLIKAVEADVQHLAAISRTPPHYLIGSVVNVSGDALAAAETGLVSKCVERQMEYGESWEQVYRLAGKVIGESIPDDAEVIWKDPEFRTLTELASASTQLMAAGVPWRTRMEMLDKSPQEIARMDAERAQDALMAQTLALLPISEGGQIGARGVAYTGPRQPSPDGTQQQPQPQPAANGTPAAPPAKG